MRGQGNDNVIVINQSVSAFPLELLDLASEEQGIDGIQWGVVNLERGACVGVWKEKGGNARYRLPEGVNCRLVGNTLLGDKKDWFGEKDFVVEYAGEQFGNCDQDQGACLISIRH